MPEYSLQVTSPENLSGGDNFLQTGYWARVKTHFSWRPFAFFIMPGRIPLLILLRRIVPGISMAYCPHGPDVELSAGERWAFLEWLTDELIGRLPGSCTFIRYDLPWIKPDDGVAPPSNPRLRKASVDVQAPDTVILDLTPDLDRIMAQMKSKTRYNIRLSSRRNVVVREGGPEDLDIWYELAAQTGRRDGIAIHAKEYFEALFAERRDSADPAVKLLVAELDGVPIGANIITMLGSRCIYHFGATADVGRNHMPSYALQWKGMCFAKDAGCTSYDLFGIPPTEDPSHPMHGLYRMKVGFGGTIIHRYGCYDYPLRRMPYAAYIRAEKLRSLVFAKKKGRRIQL